MARFDPVPLAEHVGEHESVEAGQRAGDEIARQQEPVVAEHQRELQE